MIDPTTHQRQQEYIRTGKVTKRRPLRVRVTAEVCRARERLIARGYGWLLATPTPNTDP